MFTVHVCPNKCKFLNISFSTLSLLFQKDSLYFYFWIHFCHFVLSVTNLKNYDIYLSIKLKYHMNQELNHLTLLFLHTSVPNCIFLFVHQYDFSLCPWNQEFSILDFQSFLYWLSFKQKWFPYQSGDWIIMCFYLYLTSSYDAAWCATVHI